MAWFGSLRKSQRKTLATVVFGLMNSRRFGVAAIARGIPGPVAKKHKIKLRDRFLGNRRLCVEKAVDPLISWLAATRPRLLLAPDWADLHDGKLQVLFASIILGTREPYLFYVRTYEPV